MSEGYVEVKFNRYCKSCKYKNTDERKDPCHECLSEPTNLHSSKPVNYTPRKK